MDEGGGFSGTSLAGGLTLVARQGREQVFVQLLQRGFQVNCRPGLSVKETLLHWGLAPGYIERRIETVILDGRPVDDLEEVLVGDGSTLALSAAMPGLVGATMRRHGLLSSFRSSISHHQPRFQEGTSWEEGLITVKLFNLLIGELGPTFLGLGILIERRVLSTCLRRRVKDMENAILSVKLNHEEMELAEAVERISLDARESIRFRVLQQC